MQKTIGFDARLYSESGVGRYIRNLLGGFEEDKLGFNLKVFLNTENFTKVSFKNPNIQKIKADVRWHTLTEQLTFKRIIDQQNLDLMHFPYFSYPIFYRKPFVITIHDLIIDHYPTGLASSLPFPLYWLKRLGYKKILKSAITNAEKIIVPSYATKEDLIKTYSVEIKKIAVIYEGFDKNIKRNKGVQLVSDKYILYVGNAYPHKNLERLIHAFSKVRAKHKVDLILIGRNDFFYKRIDRKIEGLKLLHDVDDSTLFEYYTNASLFVMPSLYEGFGLPLLEAMSLACPVVSSNTDALKEIAGDACVYFDPKNEDDIASKILDVLEGKIDVKKLIVKGKIQAGKFSWKQCVKETLKVYASCNSI